MAAVLLKPSELERTRQSAGVATSTQGNQSVWCPSHRESARAQLGVHLSTIVQMWQNWADATFFTKMAIFYFFYFFYFLIRNENDIFFFAFCRCI
jgi:hypothetical protein